MSRTHEEAAESPDDTRRSESGDTLIEVLIAIVILGITGVALMTGSRPPSARLASTGSWPRWMRR